jgi:hypothetical protein
VGEVAAPEPPAELVLVEVEPPQEAVALELAHGFRRQAEPLRDRVGIGERHEV